MGFNVTWSRTKAGLVATVVAAGAAAFVAPTLVSGSARTTIGSGAAQAAVERPFIANLNGANEAPTAGDADGIGAAAVTIDPVTGEVCADLRVDKIATAVASHIHRGVAGVAGPIVVNFNPPTPTSSTCVMAGSTLAAEIVANPAGFYVNVHTADYPGGAIRGQLGASGTTSGSTRLLSEPLRAYDSRETTDGPVPPLTTRIISLAFGKDGAGVSKVAVPPGAVGAIVRVTVVDTVNAGFLKVYSNALTAAPATSSVNWYETGAITGSDNTVTVDAEGKVKVTTGGNQTNVVIDVVGYVF